MTTATFKTVLGSIALAAGLAATTSASALTLNFTGTESNAVLTFSLPAKGSAAAAGIVFTPMGNTTRLADLSVVGSNGRPGTVPVYNLPVTKADVSIAWDFKISTNWGESAGAALRLTSADSGGDLGLANFYIDFKKKVIYADVIDVVKKTTAKRSSIYSFVDVVPEVVSLKGFVLNQTAKLGNMVLTESAVTQLGDGLGLDEVLRTPLIDLDWGTLDIKVTSYKRAVKITNTPFTLANVPQ